MQYDGLLYERFLTSVFFSAKVLLPQQFSSVFSVSVIFSFAFYVDFVVELGGRIDLSKESLALSDIFLNIKNKKINSTDVCLKTCMHRQTYNY